MKPLLLDQNLSPKLVPRLRDIYPSMVHVSQLGLEQVPDREIWDYARENDLIIVTKDADFGEFSVVWGTPPKVLWIRRGNCSTRDIELMLRESVDAVAEFSSDDALTVLALH